MQLKKIKLGLFPKVVIAIALGAVLGLFLPEVFIRIFKTFNLLFAQLLKFSVPLLVLGLVTPAVANLGKGAGKMLIFVIAVSYISTVGGALFSYTCATEFFPHILGGRTFARGTFGERVCSILRVEDSTRLRYDDRHRTIFRDWLGLYLPQSRYR